MPRKSTGAVRQFLQAIFNGQEFLAGLLNRAILDLCGMRSLCRSPFLVEQRTGNRPVRHQFVQASLERERFLAHSYGRE